MSGIGKLAKQSIPVITIFMFVLQFSVIGAAEKSVKASTVQSPGKVQSDNNKSAAQTSSVKKSSIQVDRVAQYKDVSDPGLMIEKSTKSQPQFRAENMNKQLKSSAFSISSAYVTMNVDVDGDGYYSDFTVDFDADTDFNIATVYARLYVSLDGGPWELYYTTDNFDIEGWSSYDDYSVRTLLTSGFPPGSYDILIDLYDTFDDSFVATISADDIYELADHYLEDVSYEDSTVGYSDFSIFDASITLLSDQDNDGYYQSFSLQFDADVDSGEAMVYAEIWVRDENSTWQLDHTTNDFLIEGLSTLDTFILETVWESGYNTGYYDFRIELYDANTFELLTTTEGQSGQLTDVPLEDAASDKQVSTGTGNNGGGTTVNQGSGGAGSFGFIILLIFLSVIQRSYMQRKILAV